MLMLLNNRLLTAAFSVLLFTSYAQQDKLVTHFMFDKMSINPGKTGIDMYNGICATSIYRNQWDKVNGAPNSTVLNIESNLSRFFPGSQINNIPYLFNLFKLVMKKESL